MAIFFTSKHKDLRWSVLVWMSIEAMHSHDVVNTDLITWLDAIIFFLVLGSVLWNSYADCLWYHYKYLNISLWCCLVNVIMELAGMHSCTHGSICSLVPFLSHQNIKVCLLPYDLKWPTHPVFTIKEPLTPKLANRKPQTVKFSVSWKYTSTKELTE